MIVSNGQRVMLGFPGQALAESAPIAGATGYFYGVEGQTLGNLYATYAHMYRVQPWVATLVNKIAASAARLSFVPWADSDAGKVEDTTSDWAKLWQRPCPTLPPFQFWRWTVSMIELYGEAFWVKMRNSDGVVVGFMPMHPARTEIERTSTGEVTYKFTIGTASSAGILEYGEDDVVPHRLWNPDNTMRGMSRIEPLRSTLENEQEARASTSAWWKRGARPSMMLSTDGKLSQQSLDRLHQQVQRQHSGSDRVGGTLILEEGMKPQKVSLSAEEMQYIESRKLNREECCAVYDVPPPVVHILDRATFSNITEQMRSMYRDTMSPRLEELESTIEHYVRRADFDETTTQPAKFALAEVLRGDFETRAEAVKGLVESGVYKPSEARAELDLPDAGPVADRLYANAAIQPLGSARVTTPETGRSTPGGQTVPDQTDQATAAEATNERS